MLSFLKGKRTYIAAAITGLLATAQALGYDVPEYVYALLGAAGLTSLRAAVANK